MENQHSKVFQHSEPIIQWFRTGEFVRPSRMGERIEKVKGVDNFFNNWIGEAKVSDNEIIEVISKAMVGSNPNHRC